MDVEIRPSTPEDLEAFVDCLDEVARERKFLAMVKAPPIEDTRAFIEGGRARGMVQLLACQGSRVVGWCDVIPSRFPGFEGTATLGMGLRPLFRGMGLGTQLMAGCLSRAKAQGLLRVELEVFGTNTNAQRLYLRHGFQVEGVKRRTRRLDGQVEDVMVMGLLLDEDPGAP